MKVRLTSKSAGCFALLTVLVSGSVQAAARELPDQIRITALNADGERKTLSTSRNVLEQFAVFKAGCFNKWENKGTIDLTTHPRKDILSHKSLSKLLNCIERDYPEEYISTYEKELLDIEAKNDIIQLWGALNYLCGPKRLRMVVVNRLEQMGLIDDLDRESCENVQTILEDSFLSYVPYGLAKKGFKLVGTNRDELDLSEKEICYIGNMLDVDRIPQIDGVKTVNLKDNWLRLWDRRLSRIIAYIAPAVQRIDLSHNHIRNIEEGVLDDLPEGFKEVNLSNNFLRYDGVLPITRCKQRGIKIDLRNNRISREYGVVLKVLCERMGPIEEVRHNIARGDGKTHVGIHTYFFVFSVGMIYYWAYKQGYLDHIFRESFDPSVGLDIDWSRFFKTLCAATSMMLDHIYLAFNTEELFGKECHFNRIILSDDDSSDDDAL